MPDPTQQELKNEISRLTEQLSHYALLQDQFFKIRDGSYGEFSFHMQMKYLLENESFPYYHFFSNMRYIKTNDDDQCDVFESQVDHLLVSPHGIFLFNTKRWKGDTWVIKYDDMDILMKTFLGKQLRRHGGYCLLNMRTENPASPYDCWKSNITDYSNPMGHICSQSSSLHNYLSMLIPDVQPIHPVLAFDVGSNIGRLIKMSLNHGKLVKSSDRCFFDVLRLKPQGTLLFFLTFLEGDDVLLPDQYSLTVLRKFLRTGIAAPDYDAVYTSDQVDMIVKCIRERRMLAHDSLYIAGHN